MKKLYLDVCSYCRPFDNQNALRIRMETEAIYLIQKHIQQKHYQAVVSPVHFKEIAAISNTAERLMLQTQLKQFETPLNCNTSTLRQRAEYLHQQGFGIADAAHIAYAEIIADIFISCDDKLLKKCQREDSVTIPPSTPQNLS